MHTTYIRTFLYIYLLLPYALLGGFVCAGSVGEGGTCSPANDRIDPTTHKFLSDCDDKTFCLSPASTNTSSANNANMNLTTTSVGICTKRQCRTDEFPFGYLPGEAVPPMCGRNYYCPDNGSGCAPVLPSGAVCDMDRDYQCATSSEWSVLTSKWNSNGSICLQSICMYANVTLGLPCVSERAVYNGLSNELNNITIARDNCRTTWPFLYCDPTSLLCEKMKNLGLPCENDRECLSANCNDAGFCAQPIGKYSKVEPWRYALTFLALFGIVITICTFLTLTHRRHRLERYYEILDYYHEQMSLRSSIVSLHQAAAARASEKDKST